MGLQSADDRELKALGRIHDYAAFEKNFRQARKAGFEAVPLCVHIGDLEGRDLQIDMKEFYHRIEAGQIPMSSQPPIGEVVDLYEKYQDSEIINIAIADGLSGTYYGACSAKEMVENRNKITVFNSRTLCGPHRYMVEVAQKMKKAGKSVSEILEWLEQAAQKTESFLIPQDFSFLKRGGRLTSVAAALGSVLKLKPVMKLTDDGTRIDKFFVKRTMSAAVHGIINYLKEKGIGSQHIFYIVHAAAQEEAENIRSMLEKAFPGLETHLMELSPVFVAQGGPKCIAIQYIER